MKNKHLLKIKKVIAGKKLYFYSFIGINQRYLDDPSDNSVTVVNFNQKEVETTTYNRNEFLEIYGKSHYGMNNPTVEKIVKLEYAYLIGLTDAPMTKKAVIAAFENKDSHLSLIANCFENVN